MSEKGLYGKYKIEKADGSALDPRAVYFTLRIDTDRHARAAIRAPANQFCSLRAVAPLQQFFIVELFLELLRSKDDVQ